MKSNRDSRVNGRPQGSQPGPSRKVNEGKKTVALLPSLPRSSSVNLERNALGTRNGPSFIPLRVPSKTNLKPTSTNSLVPLPRGRQRCQSVDLPSYESTPVCAISSTTKGKRRSKSSERTTKPLKGSRRDLTTIQLNPITLPTPRDTEVLAKMAKFIFEFLVRHDCSTRPGQWRVLANPACMTGHMFMELTKFVAAFFVGDGYFVKGKEEKDILQVSKLLKYPGQLSKSHLMTPAAQHAWPGHLTFLAWLCCRAQELFEPEQVDSMVSELANDDNLFKRVKFNGNMFLRSHAIRDEVTKNVLEDAIAILREEVQKIRCPEGNETTEELTQKKEDLTKQLKDLKNKRGTCKYAEDGLAKWQKIHASISEVIKEAEALKMKYADLSPLLFQREDLEMNIANRLKIIKGLKQQIASQPLSQDAAAKICEEIEDLKEQVVPLISLNAKLKQDCEEKTKKLENVKEEFYETCSGFFRLDLYNIAVRSLNLEDLVIPPNPFTVEELPGWLKVASHTLKRVQGTVSNMMNDAGFASKQKKKEGIKAAVDIQNLRKEVEEYKSKLEAQKDELSFISNEFKYNNNAEKKKLEEMRVENGKAEEELGNIIKITKLWEKSLEDWSQRLETFKQAEIEKRKKVSQDLAKLKLDEAQLLEYATNMKINILERKQKFFQENFGIDIFANPSEDVPDVSEETVADASGKE